MDICFNPKPSYILHLDLNSCFATIEQQANPLLRGKPVVVAAYNSPGGCILASSIEAKKLGIKTGMRVRDGKKLCPKLISMSSDPWKYRNVHLSLRKLISEYTDDFTPKSIDEFVLNLEDRPCLKNKNILEVAKEIKRRIKSEIGEYLTVSVGIAPNRYLAKIGAGLNKPDGLDEINKDNFERIFNNLKLTDLCGIKTRSALRLACVGVYSVKDFYKCPQALLRAAFGGITGYYWYLRLHGYEIDDFISKRRSYGNSYALSIPTDKIEVLSPILSKLIQKAGFRLRSAGFKTQGVHLAIFYKDGSYWHEGISLPRVIFDSRDLFKAGFKLLLNSPRKTVREIAVSFFNLSNFSNLQLDLFENIVKKENLTKSIDIVNSRWGNFILSPARMLGTTKNVPDRIAFGGVKELEEFTLNS